MEKVLSSKWGGLSEHLIATFYAVDQRGYTLTDQPVIKAPITEGTIELAANWQSPFENAGTESKVPALAAMVQSGTLEAFTSVFQNKEDKDSWRNRMAKEGAEFSRAGQGSSGMTKLNATQLFAGAPPMKINLTVQFRAFSDPANEVQAPIDQLVKWSLARQLAPDGNLVSAVKNFSDGKGFLKSLLPSLAPQMISLHYRGFCMSPLVIEPVSYPFTGPADKNGRLLNVSIHLSLSTLTALDAADWDRVRSGHPIALFNSDSGT